MKKLNKQQTINKLTNEIASLLCEMERYKSYLREESSKRAALEKEVRQLADLRYQLEQAVADNNRLRVALAEEDARAEAFEFVLRLQHGALVPSPVEKTTDNRSMGAALTGHAGLTGRG